jgi:hypothetical protein
MTTLRDLFDSVSYDVPDGEGVWWDTPLTRDDPDDGYAVFDDRFEGLHPRHAKGSGRRSGKFRGRADLTADISLMAEPALSRLPEVQAAFYRSALATALSGCNSSALARIRNRVSEFRFYPDISSVTQAHRLAGGESPPGLKVVAFWEVNPGDTQGVLHLDGASDSGQRHRDVTTDVYLHEIGRILDGVQKADRISNSPAWKKAWRAEIDDVTKRPLTAHATIDPEEGWAEYARAVMSPDPATRKKARKEFPASYQVWKDYHLV